MTAVDDGDSVKVVLSNKAGERPIPVRLYGIDAPEGDQTYGEQARRALVKLATRRNDGLVMECMDVDHLNRLVGLLYYRSADRGHSINRAMLEGGHAHWYRQFGGAELGFAEAEETARERRRGLWKSRRLKAPWVHRAEQRRGAARALKRSRRVRVVLVLILLSLCIGAMQWAGMDWLGAARMLVDVFNGLAQWVWSGVGTT